MKANEAPEKLYLHPTAKGNVGASWLIFPITNEDIEYIRKDAFMKKACEYMRNHIDQQLTIYHNESWKKRDEFILDFKNYMEEE